MSRTTSSIVALLAFTAAACSSDGSSSTSLAVGWTFSSGDCSSLALDDVRIAWGPAGGSTQTVDLPCAAGGGTLGVVGPGTYAIGAAGFDVGGIQRAESFGTYVTIGDSAPSTVSAGVTLRPKSANVVVSWTLPGGGVCPSGTILPYYVTLYVPPATPGGPLTDSVKETQQSCLSGEATLERVPPGDYVAELDSRAVTPKVYGTRAVTVVPGEDASVHFAF
jgi:hypothetical protein